MSAVPAEAYTPPPESGHPVIFEGDYRVLALLRAQSQKSVDPALNESTGFARYLRQIGEVELLTAEQEYTLSRFIQAGQHAANTLASSEVSVRERRKLLKTERDGNDAVDIFIRANLRLVVSIAKKYPDDGLLTIEDRIQEGSFGLHRAVLKYDWTKGFKFSTYATLWIKQAIGRGIDNYDSMLRMQGSKAAQLRANNRAHNQLGAPLDPETERFNLLLRPISLYRKISDSGDAELIEILPRGELLPEEVAVDRAHADSRRSLALVALNSIEDPDTRDMVARWFGIASGDKQPYQQIAETYSVTPETVRRRIKHAIKFLADGLELQWMYEAIDE